MNLLGCLLLKLIELKYRQINLNIETDDFGEKMCKHRKKISTRNLILNFIDTPSLDSEVKTRPQIF